MHQTVIHVHSPAGIRLLFADHVVEVEETYFEDDAIAAYTHVQQPNKRQKLDHEMLRVFSRQIEGQTSCVWPALMMIWA